MNNFDKYVDAFVQVFEEDRDAVQSFALHDTPQWNSTGHMSLIAALEDAFDVEFEPDEMLAITSFQVGMEVLKAKGIEF